MTDGDKKLASAVSAAVRPVAMEDKPAECDVLNREKRNEGECHAA